MDIDSGQTRRKLGGSIEGSAAAEPSERRRSLQAIWALPALAFGCVTFLLLAYLCQSAQIVRSQYRIVAVRGEVRELQAEASDLELSVCELTALERIEKLATGRLAMTIPTQRRVIEVSWQKALEKGSEVAALP
jgi:cell division protein FtsL